MCCHNNFTGALAKNNRLIKVSGVIKAFGTIMSAYRGVSTVLLLLHAKV